MILTTSLSRHIFVYYDVLRYHRMFSWLWLLTFGYIFAQTLKTNHYIQISQYKQTAFGFIYDLLNMLSYSICLFYFCNLENISSTAAGRYHIDSLLYIIPFLVSIIVFMYLGEVEWIGMLAIEWGFWDTLNHTAIIFLLVFACILIILIARQCYLRQTNIVSCLSFTSIYLLSWFIIAYVSNSNYILHLHHAFIALLFSFWFCTWTNKITFMIHAVCMGIWVEGMNLFGTEELQIFMEANKQGSHSITFSQSIIMLSTVSVIWGAIALYNYHLSRIFSLL